MWNSLDMHIGSCQSEFMRWRTIPFQCIRIDIILLLWLIIWILPQSRQVKSFIRPICHLIWYSPRLMHLLVMSKLRSWLGNSTFTTDLVLDNLFFNLLVFQYTNKQSFHQILVKYTLKDWYIYWYTLGTIILWDWSIIII